MAKDKEYFKVTKVTLLISLLTQFLRYGVNILILPLILNKFSTDVLAIWYVFIAIQQFANLLDFGISPSFSKSFSFVYAGASELKEDGCTIEQTGTISFPLLKKLLYTTEFLYKRLSVVIFSLLAVFGSLYLYFTIEGVTINTLLVWLLFSVSTGFMSYSNYYLTVIIGKGNITLNNIIILASRITYLVVLFVSIYFDCGLLSLVLANFSQIFIQYLISKKYYLTNDEKSELTTASYVANNELLRIIWTNAKKLGLTSVGVFLFSQLGIFIANIYFPLSDVAQIGLTLQLYGIIVIVARVGLSTYVPKFSSLWVRNDLTSIKRIFILCQCYGYLVLFVAVFVLLRFGNDLFLLIGSQTSLPSTSLIIAYGFFYFMELTHGNCTTLLGTENKVPFYKASLIAGGVAIIFTLIFIYSGVGILSLPLGLICSSLPYNSWKWPYIVIKRLRE